MIRRGSWQVKFLSSVRYHTLSGEFFKIVKGHIIGGRVPDQQCIGISVPGSVQS